MPRGGARFGAGRKRKERALDWLHGYPGKTTPKAAQSAPSAAEQPLPVVNCPEDVEGEDRRVWLELAPLAVELRTLTPATAQAFADLCAYIVLERRMRAAPLAVGGADHRGMVGRIEMLRARFRLVPDGKPVPAPAVPKDEWGEFDGLQAVKRA
jgi:hypothetical protein